MKDQNRKWVGLLTASLACGLIMPDETVVAVALPTIRRDLLMSLVFSLGSKLLSVGDCGVVALVGKLGDITDYGKLFVAGILIDEGFKDTERD